MKKYNLKKIHGWGFKNMVRAGQSGMIYEVFLNVGKHSAGNKKTGALESVLRFVEQLSKNQNYRLFFDNWFSTFPLLINLYSMGIFATATSRSNRIAGFPLMADKDSKSPGQGSFDYSSGLNSLLCVLKWFDNKGVIVASIFSCVAASRKQQWDGKKKEHCNVLYLDMVKCYNNSLGGIDLNDMLISIYRVDIQTKKRWYLKFITNLFSISNLNRWLLHIKYMKQLVVPKKI